MIVITSNDNVEGLQRHLEKFIGVWKSAKQGGRTKHKKWIKKKVIDRKEMFAQMKKNEPITNLTIILHPSRRRARQLSKHAKLSKQTSQLTAIGLVKCQDKRSAATWPWSPASFFPFGLVLTSVEEFGICYSGPDEQSRGDCCDCCYFCHFCWIVVQMSLRARRTQALGFLICWRCRPSTNI